MRSVAVLIAAAAALATAPAAGQAPSADEIVEKLAPRDDKPLTRSWGTAGRGITVEPGDRAAKPPSIDLHVPCAFDSAELGTDAQIILRQLGRALDDPELRGFSFRLVGHTDAKGTAEYNADLSRRRADGENYLMPVDASIEIPADLDYESLSLSRIKTELERSGAQLGRSVSTDTGLARIEGATGMLIAYATDPGNVALDGEGEHSPFTRALIEHLDAPIDVRLMFGRMRQQVYEATNGARTPWVEEAVLGEDQLARRSPADEDVFTDPVEENLWREAVKKGTWEGYFDYLRSYPSGVVSGRACERMRHLSGNSDKKTTGLAHGSHSLRGEIARRSLSSTWRLPRRFRFPATNCPVLWS